MTNINVSYDRFSDVLYLKYEGCLLVNSSVCNSDPIIIKNYDAEKRIAGLQILDASQLTDWIKHPARQQIPNDFLDCHLC